MTHHHAGATSSVQAPASGRITLLSVADWELCAPVLTAAVQTCEPVSPAHERVLRTHLRAYLSGPCGWDRQSAPDLTVLLTEDAISRYMATNPTGAPSYLARRQAALREISRALGVQPPLAKRRKTRIVQESSIALARAPISAHTLPSLIAARTGRPMGNGTLQNIVTDYRTATAASDRTGTLTSLAAFRLLAEVPNQPVKDTVTSQFDGPIRALRVPAPAPVPSRRAVAKANKAARANLAAIHQGPTVSPVVAELPADLARILATYIPHVTKREIWGLNTALADRLVAGCNPKTPRMVLNNASHIAAFLFWFSASAHRQGQPGTPIDVAELLAPDLAEQFVASTSWSTSTKATVRSTLRTTLRALDANYKPQTFPYRGAVPPYSPDECDIIELAASVQPTEARSRDLSFITALAFGAGLSSGDMRHLTPAHLDHSTEGAVTVTVPAPRARVVPMRSLYVPLLLDALGLHTASGRGPSDLILGVKPDRINVTTPAIERAEISDTTKEFYVQVSRMRNTWLIAAMHAHVPLADLLYAAGLKSARTISDLLIYCPPPSPHDLEQALKAAANIGFGSAQTEVLS